MVPDYSTYVWLIPLFPLAAFLALVAFGRSSRGLGPGISAAAAALSFLLSAAVFFAARTGERAANYTWNQIDWIKAGNYTLHIGYEVTNLNALMLLIVTLVALAVNIYSVGYMKDDPRITVFFFLHFAVYFFRCWV